MKQRLDRLNHKRFMKGFTILEMVIALSIIAFLSYTITLGVKSTRDYDKYQQDRLYLDDVRVALLTFVQSNGYLPCPDSDATPDGVENRAGNVCNEKNGFLPYKMLGVSAKDAWNQPLYYAINPQADLAGTQSIGIASESASYFSKTDAPKFTLLTEPVGTTDGSGNINICGETTVGSCSGTGNATASEKIERRAIAVVLSFGINGAETWARFPIAQQHYTLAEDENIDGDDFYWKATGSNATNTFFDDQLVWLTGYDVKYALLRSERGLQ